MSCASHNPKANLRKEIGQRLAQLGVKEIQQAIGLGVRASGRAVPVAGHRDGVPGDAG